MLRLTRFCSLLLSALLPALTASAQDAAAPSAGTPLPPDIQAELDALQARSWHPSVAAKASLGWRDNVLLSPFAPIARAFGRGELEAMVLRPMRDHWEFISFLNGDVLRYFSAPPETSGEQQWSLHTEGRWQPIEPARFSVKAAGYLRDMVIDLSETEARRVVAPTRVRGGYVGASTRLTLPAGFRFEPSVQLKRSDYRDYAGDYDEVRSGGRLEWRRSSALTLSAAWFEVRRNYAQRVQFTAGGRALPGTHLRFRQNDGEIKARTAWTAGGDWSLALTAGRIENRDEASRYFNYDQKRARLQADWRRAAWRVLLDAEAKRMDYVTQTVGVGIAPPPRISDDYEATLRVERDLDSKWVVFAEHRWERSRSNELEFSYRANTVLTGVQRSF
jgi:hypothetical protein